MDPAEDQELPEGIIRFPDGDIGAMRGGPSRLSGPEVNEARDIDLLRWIGRYGVVSPQQVARRWFTSQSAANRRLRKLETLVLVRRDRTFWHEPYAIRLTAGGAKLAQLDVGPAKLSLAELRHSLAVVDLLEQLKRDDPAVAIFTERQMRAQRLRAQRDGSRKPGTGRVPDGLLRFSDGRMIAIELDLHGKSSRDYERIIRAYNAERVDRVWWYCPSLTVAQRFREIVGKQRADDFIEVRVWVP